jgi:hypothetical protein
MNTQANVSHRPAECGTLSPSSPTPIPSRIAVSSTATTSPDSALPMKYAVFGIGVPASRFSVPSPRSIATLMPRLANVVVTIPTAMIPVVKYSR